MNIRQFIKREITDRSKRVRNIIILSVIAVVIIGLFFSPFLLFSGGKPDLQEASFIRAVDGDTIVVDIEGISTTVRLIGVNTRESTNCSIQHCEASGEAASKFTEGYFQKDQVIYLEYDKGKTDPYGRTLAYIWIRNDVRFNYFADFRKYCFNAILLDNTDCEARYYSPNGKYRRWLEHLEIMNKVNK